MLEIRQDNGDGPGIVSGVAIVYGQPSLILDRLGTRERIEPGAFGDLGGEVFMNLGHRRDRLLGRFPDGGLVLTDTPTALRFNLTLPDTADGRDTATLIRDRILQGVSIEFVRRQTRPEGRVLIVSTGTLRGMALVDRPAYPRAQVEEIRHLIEANPEPRRRPTKWLV